MLNTMRKHGVTLAIFAALTTGFTAIVHALTQGTIATQNARQQQLLFDQIIEPQYYDNLPRRRCYLVANPLLGPGTHRIYLTQKENKDNGVIMEATAPNGYSGAIQLLVGANFTGTILGARVTQHHETPGLGDKIELRLSQWIAGFSGQHITSEQDAHWAVKKDGGQFDQFTGATITPRAVVNAIKRAGLFAQTLPTQLSSLPTCGGAS